MNLKKALGLNDKTYYKNMLTLALPILLQNILTSSAAFVDTIMVGKLGEQSLTAVSVANEPFYICMFLVFGIASGVVIFITQNYGNKSYDVCKKLLSLSVKNSILLTSILVIAFGIFRYQIIGLFVNKSNTETIEIATKYLLIILPSILLFALTINFVFALRSVQETKLPLYVSVLSVFVNITFNYIFIFGKLGFEPMGAIGAAYGTLISRIIEASILLVVIQRNELLKFKLFDYKSIDKDYKINIYRKSLPIVGNEILWGLAMSIKKIVIGIISVEAIAIYTTNDNLIRIVLPLIIAFGSYNNIIIGNTIGEGDIEKAKDYGKRAIYISILMGILLAAIIYIIKPLYISQYNFSIENLKTLNLLVNLYCISTIGNALGFTAMIGVLRSGGDTMYCFIVEIVIVYVVTLPLMYIGAKMYPSVVLAFIIYTLLEIIKYIILTRRVFTSKWINRLV